MMTTLSIISVVPDCTITWSHYAYGWMARHGRDRLDLDAISRERWFFRQPRVFRSRRTVQIVAREKAIVEVLVEGNDFNEGLNKRELANI